MPVKRKARKNYQNLSEEEKTKNINMHIIYKIIFLKKKKTKVINTIIFVKKKRQKA